MCERERERRERDRQRERKQREKDLHGSGEQAVARVQVSVDDVEFVKVGHPLGDLHSHSHLLLEVYTILQARGCF